MFKNIVDNIEKYFETNTESKSRDYYKYPKLSNEEQLKIKDINNYIGVFCPSGYYYQNNNGKIDIIKNNSNKITLTQDISNSLQNFINNNTNTIEHFNNNNNCVYYNNFIKIILLIEILLLIYLLIIFYKKN